MILKGFGFVAW